MDHHTVAIVSVSGIGLDVLGGLYLAYDLLGGVHGPLRLLTRMVTYSIVFGIGYGLGLGLFFGIACGITTGVTLAIELQRASRGEDHYPLQWEAVFSAIRGAAFSAALFPIVRLPFALTFGALITAGQIVAYSKGMRPSMDYSPRRGPRISRRQMKGVVIRTVGYIASAFVCGTMVGHLDHPWLFATRVGVVTGVVTAVGTMVNPFIEYYADSLPQRRLGVFGIWLVMCGFVLQSVQYMITILDIPVT
jgi:hypothetical protein